MKSTREIEMQIRKPNARVTERHPLLAVVPNRKTNAIKQLALKAIPLSIRLFFQQKQMNMNPYKYQKKMGFQAAVQLGDKKKPEFPSFLAAFQDIVAVDRDAQKQNRKFNRHIVPYANRANVFAWSLIPIGVLKASVGSFFADKIQNSKARFCAHLAVQAALLPIEGPLLLAKGLTGFGIKGAIKVGEIGATGLKHIGKYNI